MKVRDFLTEDRWTQGAYARDKDGEPCDSNEDNACCWCLFGAIEKCYGYQWPSVAKQIEDRVGNIIDFNDTHTWAEVHAELVKADV